LRSSSRLGASFSALDRMAVGSTSSMRSFKHIGSSVSMWSCSRIGSSLSVFDFLHLGSSMSLRSVARVGSAMSVYGMSRFGSSLSVLDFFHLGSSLSLRSFCRLGSALSVFGAARFGSSLSMVGFATLASSLSLRSCARLGSSFSIFSSARLGSRLSVLESVQIGSPLSVGRIQTDKIKHGSGADYQTYVEFASDKIQMWAGGQRGLEVTSQGGTLHGAWSADATLTTSDRRLKRNIEPLYRTIASAAESRGGGPAVSPISGHKEAPVGWLLRELRPVSFNLKHGPEAKYLKFGFIAQELETIFPNLVRTVGNEDTKAVAHQDLIAVLTLALQNLQKEFEDQRRELDEQKARVARLEAAIFGPATTDVQV